MRILTLIHCNVFWGKSKTATNAEEITAVQSLKILSRLLKGTREESKYASAISKFSECSVIQDLITEDDKTYLT